MFCESVEVPFLNMLIRMYTIMTDDHIRVTSKFRTLEGLICMPQLGLSP